MSDEPYEILFRNLGEPAPYGESPGWVWQVEFHEDRGFPSGVAWVFAPPDTEEGRREAAEVVRGPYVRYVYVSDESRGRGIASLLLEACLERWPGLGLSRAISTAGAALHRKFRPRAAEDVFGKEQVEQWRREGKSEDEVQELAEEHNEAQVARWLASWDAEAD
jgi:GNAT superfamily N-acetyltransferase